MARNADPCQIWLADVRRFPAGAQSFDRAAAASASRLEYAGQVAPT